MKTIYSDNEIVHVYSRGDQQTARNATDSMSFNGDNFYSYNTIIAHRINAKTVILSDRDYSFTTANHMSLIRRAFDVIIPCYDINDSAPQNFEMLKNSVIALVKKQERARSIDYIAQAAALIERARPYFIYVGYKMPADTVEKMVKITAADRKKSDAAAKKAAADRKKAADNFKKSLDIPKIERAYNVARRAFHTGHLKPAKIIMRSFERIASDAQFYKVKIPLKIYPDFLRIVNGGVITSRGVNISTNEARAAYLLLKSGGDIIGQRFGGYRVDEINGDYIKVGCHTFPRDEISYISKKLFGEAV